MEERIIENKMGVMPIGKLIISMSTPLMASMLFQALYNIVDSMFVAMLNQDAMNAVSLTFPIQTVIIGCASGTGVGINALLARALGEKNPSRANKIANTGIFLYFCMALIFAFLGIVVVKPFFAVQTSNARILSYGTAYARICLCLSFAALGQICGESLLQSTGRTNLAMIPQITGAIFNMIMDPILILGLFGFPRLEVAGAGIATVMGQTIALIIGFTLNIKQNPEIHISFKNIRPNSKITRDVYRIGVPSILMQTAGSILTFFLNKILIGFTEAATAVLGAYYKIQSFIFLPAIGINNSLVPIVSFNYGARSRERVVKAIKFSALLILILMSFGTLMFEIIPGTLLKIFSPSSEMLSVGIPAFRIIAIHFPISAFGIIVVASCQALGKATYSLINAVLRQLIVLLPLAYCLSLTGNLVLVWFAFPISEIVSLFISMVLLKKAFRESGL